MPELHDLVAPYALDALDARETTLFEAHLETCAACRRELAEFAESAADIADSVAGDPPSWMKEAVLAATAGGPAEATVAPIARAPRFSRWASVAAVAAVAALVFAGLWVASSNSLSTANQIAAVYEAPDAIIHEFESTHGPARFVFSPGLGRGVFNGSSLVPLDETDLYEIWVIGDAAPVPSGTLIAGDSAVLVEGIRPGRTLAITVEPVPGVDAPTSEPILAAEL